jgi:hypothetical protein
MTGAIWLGIGCWVLWLLRLDLGMGMGCECGLGIAVVSAGACERELWRGREVGKYGVAERRRVRYLYRYEFAPPATRAVTPRRSWRGGVMARLASFVPGFRCRSPAARAALPVCASTRVIALHRAAPGRSRVSSQSAGRESRNEGHPRATSSFEVASSVSLICLLHSDQLRRRHSPNPGNLVTRRARIA